MDHPQFFKNQENAILEQIYYKEFATHAWQMVEHYSFYQSSSRARVGTKRTSKTFSLNPDELETLNPDSLQWSFTNGIYSARNHKFWHYGQTYNDAECPFLTQKASFRFFPVEFPDDFMNYPVEHIHVSSVEKILRPQFLEGYDFNVYLWGLFGHFLRGGQGKDGESVDNWNVILRFFGSDQTENGKKTLANIFKYITPLVTVGIIETINAPRGVVYGTNETVEFGKFINGVCHSNNESSALLYLTHYNETALPRRFANIEFDHCVAPDKRDPNLNRLIMEDVALFILKANVSYLELREKLAGQDVFSKMPPAFRHHFNMS